MKIYTSYFGNARKLENAGIKPIGIAISPPRFLSCATIFQVAPTRAMLSMPREQYEKLYAAILAKLNVQQFLSIVHNLSMGKDVALCCYEKPGEFCHRRLLADFIKEKTGIEIEEFGYAEPKGLDPQPIQQSLF